jgi:hypothetical protein
MGTMYSAAPIKSNEKEKREFLHYLKKTFSVLSKTIDHELIQTYVQSFERLGFDVGLRGIKYFHCHHLGRNIPTIAEIAQYGGNPLPQQLTEKDIAELLVSRILKGLREGCLDERNVRKYAGDIGLEVVNRLGGARLFNYSCNTEEKMSMQTNSLKNVALQIIKSNPSDPDLMKIKGGCEVIYAFGNKPKQIEKQETAPNRNRLSEKYLAMKRELGLPVTKYETMS